jgi:sialate O-acetylesterase
MSTPSLSRRLRLLAPLGALALLFLASPRAAADDPAPLTVSALFSDHAVLQRDKSVPVWGTATPGAEVTVQFHGEVGRATAAADGRWLARIGPFPASAEPSDLVIAGPTTLTLHDVLVGEVWLCGGQSNMEFKVDDGGDTYRVDHAADEVAAAHYPLIRQVEVERTVATAPLAVVKAGAWKAASPETVGKFTAVGFFFARDIHHALGVPVGIILSCWGGTPVESWMSDAARASTSVAATLDERWVKAKAEWTPERVAQYSLDQVAWDQAQKEAAANHTKSLLPWPHPPATDTSPARPGGLFNGMIAPLEPAAIRGVLWYQGEANTWNAAEYGELFGTMIRSWRDGFGQGDLPFYFVQLANFGEGAGAKGRDWALLREAQAAVLELPATGMAVTADIGAADNIHPRNKQEVGRRLALIAKARLYGVAPEVTGPVFFSATPEGAALRVRFAHGGTELESRGGPPQALEVAGADRLFHPAEGRVDVDTLVVSSAEVPAPVAVRYAWTNAPSPNLYGDAGLPVVPFRSDHWKSDPPKP